ncbi:hypothetical protein C8F01DRAFT_1376555 [Mycena amicta]|nr:hypothetical protein C8F01DRAFT_1376555 [Mycena amicta]
MSDTHLPNELLLEVFKHVPRSALSSIASSNRTFCQLARPFLFAALQFLPYDIEEWKPHRRPKLRLPGPDSVAEITNRLEFFTSDQFAPMVRAIYIGVAGWRESPRETLNEPLVDRVDAHSLLHLLVSRLARFTGLRSFTAKRVFVTPDMVTALGHISQLPGHLGLETTVTGCSFADKLASETWDVDPALLLPSLPPQSLHVTYFTLFNNDRNGLCTHWLRLLSPRMLLAVNLAGAWLHELDISALPVFPNVTHLAVDLTWQRLVYSVIARFPAVEVLHLAVCHDEPFAPTNVPPFPALLELRGPLHLAAFALGTTLRRLELTGLYSPSDILSTFTNILVSVPTTIESLTLGFQMSPMVDYDAIGAIFAHFPNVKDMHLRYTAMSIGQHRQMLQHFLTHMDDLPAILPSRLTALELSCQWYQVNSPDRGYDASYDTVALRDRLLSRCQELNKVSVQGPMFALYWERLALTVRESHKSWAGRPTTSMIERTWSHMAVSKRAEDAAWIKVYKLYSGNNRTRKIRLCIRTARSQNDNGVPSSIPLVS